MTWGPKNAFFALSEYDEVEYSLGSDDSVYGQVVEPWPLFKETIEEWNAEDKFDWSDVAVRVSSQHP